jgi:hypothetical protein
MAVEAAHGLRLPPAMQQLSRLRDTVAISRLDFPARSKNSNLAAVFLQFSLMVHLVYSLLHNLRINLFFSLHFFNLHLKPKKV